jgi:thiol-disulfide isomerase/thioredoxin
MSAPFSLSKKHFNPDGSLKQAPEKVVMLFFRHSCPACVGFYPEYVKAVKEAAKNAPNVAFTEVDTEKNVDLMKIFEGKRSPFKIEYVPLIVSYHNGKFFSKMGGPRDAANLYKYANGIGTADRSFVSK